MTMSIEEQIAAAQAAAANHTAQQGSAVAVATPTAGAVAVPSPMGTGRRLSDEDMMIGGVSVDVWFKPTHFGIQFGSSAQLVQSFIAELDLRERLLNYAIKFGQNPTTYLKSYDGAMCSSGGTWDQAIARAKAVEPTARPYNSVDLPFTVLETVKGADGSILAEAGKRAGYATSTTNWNHWESFYNLCKQKGFNPRDPNPDFSIVKVKLTNEPRAKGTNKWGVVKFDFLDWAEQVDND